MATPDQPTPPPDQELLEEMFVDTAGTYDLIVRLATLGMDIWWKRRLIRMIPQDRTYDRILDLGCGTGIVTMKLAKRFPDAEVVGIDLMQEYVDIAEAKARKKGLNNVSLRCMRIEVMDQLPGQFDLVVGSFVPKLIEIPDLISGLDTVMAPGGVLVLHDFIIPTNPMLRKGFTVYWQIVKLGMRIFPSWQRVSENLFRIIWESSWNSRLPAALSSNGFSELYSETQPLQVSKIIRVVRDVS
ncbi:MAG: methyltransferase domain-containing protein [Chloroflexi bacterium]|nr:methyltransferase domain-containing protein [Chloroflexota bacterium]